jgi:hypothetical protein
VSGELLLGLATVLTGRDRPDFTALECPNSGAYLCNVIKTTLDYSGSINLLSLLTEPAMKEFLQFVAQQLVNKPSEVDVRETSSGMISMLELRVAKEDLAGC